jgi:hypothetical protein
MGKGTCTFRETDVARAVRGVEKAGKPVAGVRFERDGGFTVLVGGKPDETASCLKSGNPWDEVLDDGAH